MEEYKSNSKVSREERKPVEKVANGKVIDRKKPFFQKITDALIEEDVDNVKSFILIDILIPNIKKAIYDIGTNSLDMFLYGNNGRNRNSTISSNVSYNRFHDTRRHNEPSREQSRFKGTQRYDDIKLESRGEAEEVLTRLDELASHYGFVRVADFYDLVGVSGYYTDNDYGWTDISIRNAYVVRMRSGEGYTIKFPKAIPLR